MSGQSKQMPIFDIRTLGDPVLRERCREVEVFDTSLLRLRDAMVESMDRARGIGLAASQVGVLKRFFVWRDPETEKISAMANPIIVDQSEETQLAEEGCLSVPGVTVNVPRRSRIVVHGQDLRGEPLVLVADNLLARILQHEIDHLDGILILDRTSPEERRRALRERTAAKLAEVRRS